MTDLNKITKLREILEGFQTLNGTNLDMSGYDRLNNSISRLITDIKQSQASMPYHFISNKQYGENTEIVAA